MDEKFGEACFSFTCFEPMPDSSNLVLSHFICLRTDSWDREVCKKRSTKAIEKFPIVPVQPLPLQRAESSNHAISRIFMFDYYHFL